MLQPPLSLSPRKSRPTSVTVHSSLHKRPLSASGRSVMKSVMAPLASTASTTVSSKEDALVQNLKQQIQCLELEVNFLKSQQQQQQAPPSTTKSMLNGQDVLSTTSGAGGAGARNTDALLRRANELEAEVVDLRQRYAQREQEHQLEVAELRQMIDTDVRATGAHHSLREELQRRESQVKQDLTSMRTLHAQEVVALQKTIERLQLEQQNAQSNIAHVSQEKDAAAKEIVSLRDSLRQAMSAQEHAQKQLQEAMLHLTSEQGLRRAAELREAKFKEDLDTCESKRAALEAKCNALQDAGRSTESELQVRSYELEQLRLTAGRQRDDLARAAAETTEAKSKAQATTAKFAELEQKLAKACQGLVDVQSEREFFRLQCDRLKVENSVLEVKASQLEQSLNAERISVSTMERQLCTALDQAEQLRRDARAKEDVYRGIDKYSTEIRVQLRLAQDERESIHKHFVQTQEDFEKLSQRFEAVRHLENQQRTEQQLQQALTQLSKSKHEMQMILSQQQRVADEFNHVLVELPEVTSTQTSTSRMMFNNSNILAGGAHLDRSHIDTMDVPAAVVTPPVVAPPVLVVEEQPQHTTTSSSSSSGNNAVAAVQAELNEIARRIQKEEDLADAALRNRHVDPKQEN